MHLIFNLMFLVQVLFPRSAMIWPMKFCKKCILKSWQLLCPDADLALIGISDCYKWKGKEVVPLLNWKLQNCQPYGVASDAWDFSWEVILEVIRDLDFLVFDMVPFPCLYTLYIIKCLNTTCVKRPPNWGHNLPGHYNTLQRSPQGAGCSEPKIVMPGTTLAYSVTWPYEQWWRNCILHLRIEETAK